MSAFPQRMLAPSVSLSGARGRPSGNWGDRRRQRRSLPTPLSGLPTKPGYTLAGRPTSGNGRAPPGNYARGEVILRHALARDTINDRESVLERLYDLYQRWEKPQEAATAAQELATLTGYSFPPHADCRLICGGRQGRNTALAGHGPS